MLLDGKCVTCYMMQNFVMCYMKQVVWHITCNKMCDVLHHTKCVTCFITQNEWCVTWHKMYDMLHVTWCTMCYMLHDGKCVTCYMPQKMWHVICNKECDVLHATKTINNTPTNQTLNEYIHPDITGCLSSYSWIFIHLSQLIQWTN